MFKKLLMIALISLYALTVSAASEKRITVMSDAADVIGFKLNQNLCVEGMADCPFSITNQDVVFNPRSAELVAGGAPCTISELFGCFKSCGPGGRGAGCSVFFGADGTRHVFCHCP